MSSVPKDGAERKRLGAWYTPPSLVEPLVNWAVRPGDRAVLDPAVGDGAFLVATALRLREMQHTPGAGACLYGFDINPEAVSTTRCALLKVAPHLESHVSNRDFFETTSPDGAPSSLGRVDAVVGNPPYVRYQRFSGPARRRALERARAGGVRLKELSSSWAPFVIHATSFLRSGGRLALVLPEELIHSGYAEDVRLFLRRRFRTVSLVQFEEHLFPDSQERVLLLLAEGKDQPPYGLLRLVSLPHPGAIRTLMQHLEEAEVFEPESSPEKWVPGFDDDARRDLERMCVNGDFAPLSEMGKAGIGYVTGANDFFILTKAQAAALRFPGKYLGHTVSGARQIPGTVLTSADLRRLLDRGERCLLWDGRGADYSSVSRYIRAGIAKGIHLRYKCRVRTPWYRVPGVTAPDAFLTYMADAIPRLVLNRARATCSNTLHAVHLNHCSPAERARLVVAFYNSATMLSAERIGRRYGGGVLKLEPSEAVRLLIPSRRTLAACPDLDRLLPDVDALIRARRFSDALHKVDRVVLEEACGLPRTRVQQLHESLLSRREARQRVRALSMDLFRTPRERAAQA